MTVVMSPGSDSDNADSVARRRRVTDDGAADDGARALVAGLTTAVSCFFCCRHCLRNSLNSSERMSPASACYMRALTGGAALRAVSLHTHMCIQMIQRAVCFCAIGPRAGIQSLNLVIPSARAFTDSVAR